MKETDSTEWQTILKGILVAATTDSKVVLVGVGHPLRGDDYVGSFIVESLGEKTSGAIQFFNGEDNVEAIITRIGSLRPEHVVFIDACDMNLRTGEARLVTMNETNYPFFTTHGIPLKLLAERFLPNSQSWVLAIQPKQVEIGSSLSPKVSSSAKSIVEFIRVNMMEENAFAS
jgi:hydrogenase 3 maturation protease